MDHIPLSLMMILACMPYIVFRASAEWALCACDCAQASKDPSIFAIAASARSPKSSLMFGNPRALRGPSPPRSNPLIVPGEAPGVMIDPIEKKDLSIVAEVANRGKRKLDRVLAQEIAIAKGPIVVACKSLSFVNIVAQWCSCAFLT